MSSKSYYRMIGGERYDRSLLDAAEVRLKGQGDGRISEQDLHEIIELSRDGKGITETEMRTLEYITLKFNLTTKARSWFKDHQGQIRSEVIQTKTLPEKILPPAINKEKEELLESNSDEILNTTGDDLKMIMDENNQRSGLLVHVLWATLFVISIITVRSIYIEQADADQNLQKLLLAKQNSTLLAERVETMEIEKKQLKSQFQELEKSMKDELLEKKQLESQFQELEKSMKDELLEKNQLETILSREKFKVTHETKPEVLAFNPDKNNCCFCSCETSAIEESLKIFR